MTLLQALALGILQGLTEFLPISSSGHLIIFPWIFGWKQHSLTFDTTLHLGTALALLIYFYKDLWLVFSSLLKDVVKLNVKIRKYSDFGKLGVFIVIGSIPAGILGLLLQKAIENQFRSVAVVLVFLVLGSVLMFIAEKFSKMSAKPLDENLPAQAGKSFIIGLFQALALFPGISRSGSTISAGMLLGLTRQEAARFSFLLSTPIIVVAALLNIVESSKTFIFDLNVLVGFFASFIIGILSIKFLMEFTKNRSLYIFVVYRLLLSLFLLVLLL